VHAPRVAGRSPGELAHEVAVLAQPVEVELEAGEARQEGGHPAARERLVDRGE